MTIISISVHPRNTSLRLHSSSVRSIPLYPFKINKKYILHLHSSIIHTKPCTFIQLKDQYWSLLYTLWRAGVINLSRSPSVSLQDITWGRLLKALPYRTSRWCPRTAYRTRWLRCTIWVINHLLLIFSHPTGMCTHVWVRFCGPNRKIIYIVIFFF